MGEQQVRGEKLVDYVMCFKDKALECLDASSEKEIVRMCIKGMMNEYRIHIENHLVIDFVELLIMALNTGVLVTCRHCVARDNVQIFGSL